jgi:hypothetical protein
MVIEVQAEGFGGNRHNPIIARQVGQDSILQRVANPPERRWAIGAPITNC